MSSSSCGRRAPSLPAPGGQRGRGPAARCSAAGATALPPLGPPQLGPGACRSLPAEHRRRARARRAYSELRTLYEAARGKVGTLAEVIGGHCVSHGLCAAKFACVGCAGKVPDPAKRPQIERHRAWAQTQVGLATDDGLFPEAERTRQVIRDCDSELQEMDQIDAYRRDEARAADIRIAPAR